MKIKEKDISIIQKQYPRIDFFLVGAPRCATTWLYKVLEAHSQICVSKKKEFVPFDNSGGVANSISTQFTHCLGSQINGVFPVSLFIRADGAELIKKYFPHTKILFLIRNPVERAYSHYNYRKSFGVIDAPDLKTALQKESSRVDILQYGLYADALSTYERVFEKDHIKVITYDDVKSNPKQTIKGVYKFLGVNDIDPKLATKYFNARHEKFYRSKMLLVLRRGILDLTNWIKNKKGGNKIISILKSVGAPQVFWWFEKNNTVHSNHFNGQKKEDWSHDEMDNETRTFLENYYKEDIEKTAKILRRLTDKKTDDTSYAHRN